MKATPDTPDERDAKADALKVEREDKAAELEEKVDEVAAEKKGDEEAKAYVLAHDLILFKWEIRFYVVVLLAYGVLRSL